MIWYMNCKVFGAMASPTFFQSCFAWMAYFKMSGSAPPKLTKMAGVCNAAFAHPFATTELGSSAIAAAAASINARTASQPLARRSLSRGGAKPPTTSSGATTMVSGVCAGIGWGPSPKKCFRKWSMAPWLSGIPGTAKRKMSNQNRFTMHLYSGRSALFFMHVWNSLASNGCPVAPLTPISGGQAARKAVPSTCKLWLSIACNFSW